MRYEPLFSFLSYSLPKDTFHVVDFNGTEMLSRQFRFEITLLSHIQDMPAHQLLRKQAAFTIHGKKAPSVFFGMLVSFEHVRRYATHEAYRAVLQPRSMIMNQTENCRVFLDQDIREYLTSILKDNGFQEGTDFDFRLTQTYPKREFVCQYNESDSLFIARKMAEEGLYLFFEPLETANRAVITDDLQAHVPAPHAEKLRYAPSAGMNEPIEEVLHSFLLRETPMPARVRLKDWNYRIPRVNMLAEAAVAPDGRGFVNEFGDHFQSVSQGERLAKVRSQELLCGRRTFYGTGGVPYLRPGYTFSLSNHFREDFNQEYLVTQISHQGSQQAYLVAGMDKERASEGLFYRNNFEAIPATTQYRPPRIWPRPRMTGTVHARIDAQGEGEYAEVDDQGRYKVVLPFDLSGRKDGHASSWLRMGQHYAGTNHGLHMPLHKGTEVALMFVDGDPDRPFIAAALPNPAHPSQVTAANASMSMLTTGGQNKIHIEDKKGKERILLHSLESNTFLRLGAPNDPPSGGTTDTVPDPGNTNNTNNTNDTEDPYEPEAEVGFTFSSANGGFTLLAGESSTVTIGSSVSDFFGVCLSLVVGGRSDINIGIAVGVCATLNVEVAPIKNHLKVFKNSITKEEEEINVQATQLMNQLTHLREEATQCAEEALRLEGERTELVREKQELKDDIKTLSTDCTSLVKEEKELIEKKNEMIGDNTQMREKNLKVARSNTRLCGKTNHLAQKVNTLAESITVLADQQMQLCDRSEQVATDVVVVSGMVTQV